MNANWIYSRQLFILSGEYLYLPKFYLLFKLSFALANFSAIFRLDVFVINQLYFMKAIFCLWNLSLQWFWNQNSWWEPICDRQYLIFDCSIAQIEWNSHLLCSFNLICCCNLHNSCRGAWPCGKQSCRKKSFRSDFLVLHRMFVLLIFLLNVFYWKSTRDSIAHSLTVEAKWSFIDKTYWPTTSNTHSSNFAASSCFSELAFSKMDASYNLSVFQCFPLINSAV